MNVLDRVSGELPPCATYSRRVWHWFPAANNAYEPFGWLVVQVQYSRRLGVKFESVRYAVEETTEPGCPERVFLVFAPANAEQDEPYEVRVGPGYCTCTCRAARCRVPVCKHRDSFAAMVEQGVI
jgi:hypothetical protein